MSRFEGLTREDLDALSQLVAEHTIEHGVERIITQEILQERCRHYTEVAKQELEKCGPESDNDRSDFCPTATVFGASGVEASNVRVGFKDGQKRQMMYALSQTCKTLLAQAVVFRMVATACNLPEVAKAMGLNMPDPRDRQKMRYLEERMWKWIEKNYGRERLSALPPELRKDVIWVCGIGPKLKDAAVITEYRWENGQLVFNRSFEEGEMRMEMIPRWWQ
jgi:hypothetical protein